VAQRQENYNTAVLRVLPLNVVTLSIFCNRS